MLIVARESQAVDLVQAGKFDGDLEYEFTAAS